MTEPNRHSAGADLFRDEHYLQELRSQMLRFAELQLSDTGSAEDAVQEALIGAMKNIGSFAGGAAFKTWVFAILKNKIADVLRKKQRLINVGSLLDKDDNEPEDFTSLFDARGFWHMEERPAQWGDPEASLQNGHFWRIFEACLDHLPPRQARVFMMREFIGLNTQEICESVSLTVSNLHVLLHRARLRLRECLEDNWFAEKAQ